MRCGDHWRDEEIMERWGGEFIEEIMERWCGEIIEMMRSWRWGYIVEEMRRLWRDGEIIEEIMEIWDGEFIEEMRSFRDELWRSPRWWGHGDDVGRLLERWEVVGRLQKRWLDHWEMRYGHHWGDEIMEMRWGDHWRDEEIMKRWSGGDHWGDEKIIERWGVEITREMRRSLRDEVWRSMKKLRDAIGRSLDRWGENWWIRGVDNIM